jgi:hypothetical protein
MFTLQTSFKPLLLEGEGGGGCWGYELLYCSLLLSSRYLYKQRKDIYIENRAGKVARLASWRKMTQPGGFCW